MNQIRRDAAFDSTSDIETGNNVGSHGDATSARIDIRVGQRRVNRLQNACHMRGEALCCLTNHA